VSDYGQTDEPRPRRRGTGADGTPPPYDQSGGTPPADDSMAALEQRLQAMTPGASAAPAPAPEVTTYSAPPQALSGPPPRSRGRTRPAARRRSRFSVATIAAPVVFLVAVIVLVSLVYQSGIVGGDDGGPVVTPTPKATKTKAGGGGSAVKVTYKKYTVREGDTLSGIAVKYGTTVNAILALNPDMSTSTLVVGTKIKVPKPSPSPSP
jgi:LysM repeat protein